MSRLVDVRHYLFFARLNCINRSCCHLLNTSLICPCVGMVIHLIFSILIISKHIYIATIVHKYHLGSELKPCNMVPDLHAWKKVFWKKEHNYLKRSWPASNWPLTSRILFGFCLQCTCGMFSSSTLSMVHVLFCRCPSTLFKMR